MPTGAAVAVGFEWPLRLARLREFPEREVERIFLVLVNLDARARFELLDVAMAELPVIRKAPDAIVDAILHGIRVSVSDKLANHRLYLRDVGGSVGLLVGLHHTQLAHRFVKFLIVSA